MRNEPSPIVVPDTCEARFSSSTEKIPMVRRRLPRNISPMIHGWTICGDNRIFPSCNANWRASSCVISDRSLHKYRRMESTHSIPNEYCSVFTVHCTQQCFGHKKLKYVLLGVGLGVIADYYLLVILRKHAKGHFSAMADPGNATFAELDKLLKLEKFDAGLRLTTKCKRLHFFMAKFA